MRSIGRIVGVIPFLLLVSTGARPETINCNPITSVPATISAPGIYCLRASLMLTDPSTSAITIVASDVVLDLNGWTLAGPGSSGGIVAGNVRNVTVRNGTVRGFSTGVSIGSSLSEGNLVERLHVDRNTTVGINVMGRGVRVSNNTVSLTGGGTFGATGIRVHATNAHVADNQVVETIEAPGNVAYGIWINATPATVERNVISNLSSDPELDPGPSRVCPHSLFRCRGSAT